MKGFTNRRNPKPSPKARALCADAGGLVIERKKKGRPFEDPVLDNTPESHISGKRSVFRCLKKFL